MAQTLSNVFKFVTENQNFRATIGVIASSKAAKTILAWGAVNQDTNETWVPELNEIKDSWDDASWTPVTEQQASLFDSTFKKESEPRQEWLLTL